jgi:hypothetical protein
LTPYALSLKASTEIFGIPRTSLYNLIAEKQIVAKKIGRRTMIITSSLQELIDRAPNAQIGRSAAV